MVDFIAKLFIFLVAFGMGFLLACIGAARIIAEKATLKDELEKVKAERDELKANQKVKVIEIHDGTVGKDLDFGGF